ncbi:porin [Dokdonia sp.]|uniref:porin n=1 Tax=Dokdonia sp. TaxID=2024995 RepID=UPI003267E5C2
MKLKLTLIAVLLCTCFTLNAQQTTDSKFGKGVFNVIAKDSSWSMKFATRMQFLSTSTLAANDPNSAEVDQNFLVRRARFKFNGFAFSPKFKYKFELGLSNRDISGASQFTRDAPRYILDAVVMWNFAPDWELWVGQTKLPGNIERVISSGNLQFVDRSLLNSRFNIDRDVGLQLRHKDKLGKNFVIREKIAVSQGEGRNVTQGNQGGLQYTGRVEFLPFGEFTSKGDYSSSDLKREPTPKLMVAATYDHNNNAVRSRSNLGSYLFIDGSDDPEDLFETNINTIFVDAIFKYQGFSFQGEYAHRDAEDVFAINTDGTTAGNVEVGNSINLQAGYLLPSNWEFSGRYTNVTLDDIIGGRDTDQYTVGASKFIVGHKLKVQSDLTYETINGDGTNWIFRLQLDVHF